MKQARHPTTIDLLERPNGTDRDGLFRSARRRAVMRILSEAGHGFDLESLAERVAAREADTDDPTDEAIRRVTTSLHHNHVPRLAHHGAVSYDSATNRIERPDVRDSSR